MSAQFHKERLIRLTDFVSDETLSALQEESDLNQAAAERSYIPGHKQGGTVSYEAIHRTAPCCLALYHAPELQAYLSTLVGETLYVTADHDQSSCSLLYYDRAGDRIGWHYDHNFYQGRHFTVLLTLCNSGPINGLSSSQLQRQSHDHVLEVPTMENTLVIFEGAKVRHRVTPIQEGEQRVVLSMTFCTDPRLGRFKELLRRIKDTAYYGPRVLLD